jgi:hypothetical protein
MHRRVVDELCLPVEPGMHHESDRTQLAEFRRCPSCGLANALTNRFCTSCGTALTDSASDADEVASGDDAPGSDRSTMPIPGHGLTSRFASVPQPHEASIDHVRSPTDRVSYPLDDGFTVGRQAGDLTVPDDRFLSASHFAVRRVGSRFVLTDLDSSNGTFIRLRNEVELRPGDEILIGGQVFRFLV